MTRLSEQNGIPDVKASKGRSKAATAPPMEPKASVTNPEKVFWPKDGYTKGDLVAYYRAISKWMLPYLKDRPVMLTRWPDGIEGKMFYQKDAPAFAPPWIRTEKIYSEDSQREISYFILDSEEALAYIANLAAITIHMWSSRIPHLERPDWLLFDIDPKGSTTMHAVEVAREVAAVLREVGLEPVLKTSGQMGLHVVVGLAPKYTYEQAKMFSELVAQVVVNRIPKVATINRNPHTRKGRVYIDYLQLGHGKTIAATFSVRPVPRAPVSAPMTWKELKPSLDPDHLQHRNDAGPDVPHETRPLPRRNRKACHPGRRPSTSGISAQRLWKPPSGHSFGFGGAVTSLNARIASTAVGTPLYCETCTISSLISSGGMPEVQCSAHVESQLRAAPERHQRGHREQRAQLDRQAGTTPDRAEQLFVEKGCETLRRSF